MVAEFVRSCEVCQRNKHLALAPARLLQPLLLPERIWEEVSMDFIEGLPRSEGVGTTLVVVDRLSKYSHFISLRHQFTAQIVAEKLLDGVEKLAIALSHSTMSVGYVSRGSGAVFGGSGCISG